MEKVPSLNHVNFYYITSENMELPVYEQVSAAIGCGVRMIQYRNKNDTAGKMYQEAVQLKNLCSGRALFIVNDRVDIAMAVGADGVHLGQDDLPGEPARRLIGDLILGISTHDIQQAREASKIADYIGIGPVHRTDTKESADKALGVQGVLDIAGEVDVPTAAIGGIREEDIVPLAQEVDMLCAISSVCGAGDFNENILHFENTLCEEKRRRQR